MPISEPYPMLEEIMRHIGLAGSRLDSIGASEGAAGNISVYLGWDVELRHNFPDVVEYALPVAAPELAGGIFLVTGSGCRLGEIGRSPEGNLCAIRINPGGETALLHTSRHKLFEKPTSEFNSHLAVHREMIARDGLNFHTVIHAQPLHLTYLSQIPAYQNTLALNRRILRWQPETIIHLPQGVAYLPFKIPGSDDLMRANIAAMKEDFRIVLWAKHGVMARSDQSVQRAADRIEYAETGARYEWLDMASGQHGEGLTDEEMRTLCAQFGVVQNIF